MSNDQNVDGSNPAFAVSVGLQPKTPGTNVSECLLVIERVVWYRLVAKLLPVCTMVARHVAYQ